MRIPKRVDAAWDWAERHGRALTLGILVVVAVVGALVMPTLGALAVGLLIGGVVVYRRLARRIERLRADNDQLLRDNGNVHHQLALMRRGVKQESSLSTQVLPYIPDSEEQVVAFDTPTPADG
ncbi:hypothetical protein [Actinocorallia longicatena]|uniref:DUF3040 family protein n=1 Tax=Actinocorallia longicatena TaxID=111803 RepID=A0ABP6QNA9_9ACTN